MDRPSKSPRTGDNGVEANEDPINNLPVILIDKILKRLTVFEQAKMSVLSKKWRHNWLCVQSLVFDEDFWEKQRKQNGRFFLIRGSRIISSILFCHIGTVRKFYLVFPKNGFRFKESLNLNLNPWLCFLSRSGVNNIILENLSPTHVTLPSSIFSCIELKKLGLHQFIMNPPPAEFENFQHLQMLELVCVESKHDMVVDLITNFLNLNALVFKNDKGGLIAKHLVINAPRLEALVVWGKVKTLTFKKVPKLKFLGLCLENESINNHFNVNIVDEFVNLLTSTPPLNELLLGRNSCKILVAGGIMNSFPLAFTHLSSLYINDLELDDFDVVSITHGLIQSCPSIKKLFLRVSPSEHMEIQDNLTYDKNFKLEQLHTVEFEGLTGSLAEVELIKYLLHASTALEKFFIILGELDAISEMKLQRELNGLQRASSKAQIVFLEESLFWSELT